MKNFILTGMLALLCAVLIPSCQPDEPENILFEELLEQTEIGRDPNLATLLSDFTGQSLNGRTDSTAMPFGTLDYNEIVVRVASEDQPRPNYTIRLIPPDIVRNTREYLVLIGEEDGYWGYILQYEPDFAQLHTLHEPAQFTGHARLLDFDRKTLSDNIFEDGVDTGSDNTTGRTEDSYVDCNCRYGGHATPMRSDGTADWIVDRTTIVCSCKEPSGFDGTDAGGGGRTYLP
ncbi:MAG: hypothetical protein WBA74_04300 [Cyclobacteriaceae bacterium]